MPSSVRDRSCSRPAVDGGEGPAIERARAARRPCRRSSRAAARPGCRHARCARLAAPSRGRAGSGESLRARAGRGTATPSRRTAQPPGAWRSPPNSSSAPCPESATVTSLRRRARRGRGSRAPRDRRAARPGARRAPRGDTASSVNESSSSCARCRSGRRRARASASSLAAVLAKADRERLDRLATCCGPSARRSGSSRGRRESIAPSGTSLISRRRTDSSSVASSCSEARPRASSRSGSGAGYVQ